MEIRSFRPEFAISDDGNFTPTSTEQKRVEDIVQESYDSFKSRGPIDKQCLFHRNHHVNYLMKSLKSVPISYASLDASRTWICFWSLNGLRILDAEIPEETQKDIIRFIKSCEDPKGGYGGGPGQSAHLAPTYAAVMALVLLKSEEALKSIDRPMLLEYLLRMKQPDGSFTMHDDGEADMRSSYCAVAVAIICDILTDELRANVAEWIAGCQTYEGGFGGESGVEAHGGYTYCAVAALALLDKFSIVDDKALLRWLVHRQMKFEGGFQGRTNKLVDGCYSFWQAAVFPILEQTLEDSKEMGLFDSRMLEEYILICCQSDLYHTCYVLAGLAIAQQYSILKDGHIFGGDEARVNVVNPLFNVDPECEHFAKHFFSK
ncbi:hypothetical protein WR25_11617 [Diploscapter pachys]|uniref:Protein farnesyltransferase subunit beta n=1 Tax=Diploscapter pachys TaxID=2018661 RepID=A0A2A2KR97_9BILA|nr:hypothetical protein WR25_11617 [Diploscapter pachys]